MTAGSPHPRRTLDRAGDGLTNVRHGLEGVGVALVGSVEYRLERAELLCEVSGRDSPDFGDTQRDEESASGGSRALSIPSTRFRALVSPQPSDR